MRNDCFKWRPSASSAVHSFSSLQAVLSKAAGCCSCHSILPLDSLDTCCIGLQEKRQRAALRDINSTQCRLTHLRLSSFARFWTLANLSEQITRIPNPEEKPCWYCPGLFVFLCLFQEVLGLLHQLLLAVDAAQKRAVGWYVSG